MPSPIAHFGAGYAVYRIYQPGLPEELRRVRKFPLKLIIILVLSMIPDLDIIPAVLFRDMEGYHNNLSHSLLLAIPAALLIGVILSLLYRSNFWPGFLVSLISYGLHIIMDFLTAERGVMMLWPLTQARFASPIKIFYGLQWGLGWFSIWHLWTILTESLFVGVVILAVNYVEKRRLQLQQSLAPRRTHPSERQP